MSKFNVGDKVVIVENFYIWSRGEFPNTSVLTVVEDRDDTDTYLNRSELTIEMVGINGSPNDFKLVDAPFGGFVSNTMGVIGEAAGETIIPITENLGVYRPNLEDRKVGKVRVELVDDGFPLALREIAKVMTWAQTAKGYKDHDWQNLPNPEQGLAGATSRHRTDHVIQRMVGKSAAIECTDHESEILHKAHEAFGVLAQLELILRGVIK